MDEPVPAQAARQDRPPNFSSRHADNRLDCSTMHYAVRDCVSTKMRLTPGGVPVTINSPDLNVIRRRHLLISAFIIRAHSEPDCPLFGTITSG